MTAPILGLNPYTPRKLDPRRYNPGQLRQEFVNVVQKVTGNGAVYPVEPGEIGVIDVRYPVGDIRRYGAISSGPASRTVTAFINALASLPLLGGTIYVPTGVWNISQQISVTTDNVAIVCEVGANLIADVPNTDAGLFVVGPSTPVDRFTMTGATISGAFPWGIYIAGGSGHRVSDNTISGGTVAVSGKCGGIYAEDISDFEIDWNVCSGNGDATLDAGADIQLNNGDTTAEDGSIHDNTCTSTLVCFNIAVFNPIDVHVNDNTCSGARVRIDEEAAGYGIMLYNTVGVVGQAKRNHVVHNNVSSVEGIGIFIQNVHDTSVIDNDVYDTSDVMIDGSLTPAGITFEGLRGTCALNRVRDVYQHGIVVNGGVDATLGGHGTLVTGNSVRNVGLAGAGDGICVGGVTIDDVTIIGNHVETVDNGSAIGVRSFSNTIPATGLRIKGNTIKTVDAAGAGIFTGSATTDAVIEDNNMIDIGDADRGLLLGGEDILSINNTVNGVRWPEGVSADNGDASVQVVAYVDQQTQRWDTTLTAGRTATLMDLNARNGARFRVVRSGGGAFNLTVQDEATTALKALAASEWGLFEHDGTAWALTAFGAL